MEIMFTNRYHKKFADHVLKVGDYVTDDEGTAELVVTRILSVTFENDYIVITGEGRDRNE